MRRRPEKPSPRGLALVLALSAALGGCADRRTRPPDLLSLRLPGAAHRVQYPGLSFVLPAGWFTAPAQTPLLATAGTGLARVAFWRYPRLVPVPRTRAELRAALPSLLAAVRARDPTYVSLGARPTTVGGHPALQVVGEETVSGSRRKVRSEHVFAYGAEVVVDAYAPPAQFRAVNRDAFVPLLRSLTLAPVP